MKGKRLWKQNNLLFENNTCMINMKNHITTIFKKNLKNKNITAEYCIWDFLKYEILKFPIEFSKKCLIYYRV